MKKLLALLLAMVMIFAFAAACGEATDTPTDAPPQTDAPPPSDDNPPDDPPPDDPPPATTGFELALITDIGTIDDKSFNQGAWEGLEQYALENDITHKYYRPAAQGDDDYLNAIDLAVQEGAKVIVTPGFLFEAPIFIAQDRYPDVKFILLDGTPHSADYSEYKTGDNTVGITYAEHQSGFLAGYAAVIEGYTELGFMGGMAVPAVIRFGHGFIQGAEYAAEELGMDAGSINMKYFYTGVFEPQPEIQTRAASWYEGGTEVIFACGGGICFSIFPPAEQTGNFTIGVDVDQSGESPTVITSAMKLLQKSVYDQIAAFYEGNFPGGQNLVYAADNMGVGLPPVATSKLNVLTQAQYDDLFAKLVDGTVVVSDAVVEMENPDPLLVFNPTFVNVEFFK